MNKNAETYLLKVENAKLRAENEKIKAMVEYIGAMDYPEILEEVEYDLRNGEEVLPNEVE